MLKIQVNLNLSSLVYSLNGCDFFPTFLPKVGPTSPNLKNKKKCNIISMAWMWEHQRETFRIFNKTEKEKEKEKHTNLTCDYKRYLHRYTLPHIPSLKRSHNLISLLSTSLSLSLCLGLGFLAFSSSQLCCSTRQDLVRLIGISLVIWLILQRMMEETNLFQWSVIRSLLAIIQWWGFNVTVIIMNKWIFQVRFFITCSFSVISEIWVTNKFLW